MVQSPFRMLQYCSRKFGNRHRPRKLSGHEGGGAYECVYYIYIYIYRDVHAYTKLHVGFGALGLGFGVQDVVLVVIVQVFGKYRMMRYRNLYNIGLGFRSCGIG